MVHMEEARSRQEERPFDPAAPRKSYAQPHHFAVNANAVDEEIVESMARTFFVSAWADAMEEAGRSRELSGQNLMDIAPETPDEAYEKAGEAARRIEDANGAALSALYEKMAGMPGRHRREPTPDDFGFSLAMMYMGSGVSWFDDHPGSDSDLDVPYGEGMWIDGAFEENARGPRGEVDRHAAEELVMYIENTADLSLDGPRGQGNSILLNLMRKWRKGKYESPLAVKLFMYLTESGAKRYVEEMHSSLPWNQMFNVPTRTEAARQLEASFRERAEQGEYDDLDLRIRR